MSADTQHKSVKTQNGMTITTDCYTATHTNTCTHAHKLSSRHLAARVSAAESFNGCNRWTFQ